MEGKKLLAATPFPSVGDLLAMLGLFFVVQLGCSLIGIVLLLFTGRGLNDLSPNELGGYLALTSFASMSLISLLIVAYRHWRKAPSISWGLRPRAFDLRLLVWGFLLMAALGILLEPLYEVLPALDQEVGRGFWSVVALVAIAPLFEEFICRALIFGSLRTHYGLLPSMLLSALFFGVLHLQPTAVINAFLMGLILAYLYELSRTLWCPILLHALNNGVAYLLLVKGFDQKSLGELLGEGWLYPTIWVGSLAIAAWVAYLMWEVGKKGAPEGKNHPEM